LRIWTQGNRLTSDLFFVTVVAAADVAEDDDYVAMVMMTCRPGVITS